MTLIDKDELDRLKQRQIAQYNPELKQMAFLKDEMDSIMNRSDLGNDEKLRLFQTAQFRFNSIGSQEPSLSIGSTSSLPTSSPAATAPVPQIKPEPSSAIEEMIKRDVPEKSQGKLQNVLDRIKRNTDRVSWNDKAQLVLDGEAVPGSNIVDLVKTLYSNSQIRHLGHEEFVRALQDVNVPMTSISNSKLKREYEPYSGANVATASSPFGGSGDGLAETLAMRHEMTKDEPAAAMDGKGFGKRLRVSNTGTKSRGIFKVYAKRKNMKRPPGKPAKVLRVYDI